MKLAMKTKTNKRPSAQIKAFQEAALKLGCDESEERFDAALKKVVEHKLKPKAVVKRRQER